MFLDSLTKNADKVTPTLIYLQVYSVPYKGLTPSTARLVTLLNIAAWAWRDPSFRYMMKARLG